METLLNPEIWIALATLTALELVLGIDNIIFISILAGKLPPEQRNKARRMGITLAAVTRLTLLLAIAWIVGLTAPLFSVFDQAFSWRDLILIGGGLFLIGKATHEIHQKLEGASETVTPGAAVGASFSRGDRADHGAGHRVLARLHHHRGRHGRRALGDDHRDPDLHRLHADVRACDRRFRRAPSDRQGAGAELPDHDRPGADRRRLRPAHPEGLHLLRRWPSRCPSR